MSVPANISADAQTAEARQAVAQVARFWWAWLVVGCLWIVASIIILQFNRRSVVTVGIVLGVMFLVAGIQELVLAYLTEGGWRWLWVAFGVLLVGGGIWALFNPTHTVVAVADILGFVFVLIGVGWLVQAFAAKESSDLWWLHLIAAIVMIGLGFWAAGQFLAMQIYVLVAFAGIWALLHGITDIISAFQIKGLEHVVDQVVAEPGGYGQQAPAV